MRWKIEIFHKILKSGCKAEEVKLRTADRLVNLLAIFCILSWRVFWVTMSSRSSPEAPPETALTTMEIKVLDRLAPDKPRDRILPAGIGRYAVKSARLGGYLARAMIRPPATPSCGVAFPGSQTSCSG